MLLILAKGGQSASRGGEQTTTFYVSRRGGGWSSRGLVFNNKNNLVKIIDKSLASDDVWRRGGGSLCYGGVLSFDRVIRRYFGG